jgi:cytidylate kinase
MNNIKLAILALCLACSVSLANANDDMVEFCAATLMVAQETQEYDLWRRLYNLDMTKVEAFQLILEHQLEDDNIARIEITEAATACKAARMLGVSP